MLVGVLVSIMISIVVGVSLVPTIVTSINTAKADPNIPAGLGGLLDVLSYVFVAVILLGAVAYKYLRPGVVILLETPSEFGGSLRWLYRAKLSNEKCVETRWKASLVGMMV